MAKPVRIAIVGGGPSALFVCKHLLDKENFDFTLDILEAGDRLGAGMPYSAKGANIEHVTNVSANEIPELFQPLDEWVRSLPDEKLAEFYLDKTKLHEYRVVPRLLFGDYLSAQLDIAIQKLKQKGVKVTVHFQSRVTDILEKPDGVMVEINNDGRYDFDKVIVSTGHYWPKINEGKTANYFDSPYPPAKLDFIANYPVALRGSSLTAIDAIKTLARANGYFEKDSNGKLQFTAHETSPDFSIVMHSVHGFLPCLRFHLEEPLISGKDLLPEKEIQKYIEENDGFLPLDIVFEKSFKEPLAKKRPAFYDSIKDMSIEDFVEVMLSQREEQDPFILFQREMEEAEISMAEHRSIYWKEMLASLSFAMNYPAKHFSAEDMLRVQKTLSPLIAVVIAFIPQGSANELLALYRAGRLKLVSVNRESHVDPNPDGGGIYVRTEDGQELRETYHAYVDCVGQKHFDYKDFPFEGLKESGTISPARVEFRKGGELALSGIAITDDFQVIGKNRNPSEHIFIMAAPYIGGHNPDYSGLDFCEEASKRIVGKL